MNRTIGIALTSLLWTAGLAAQAPAAAPAAKPAPAPAAAAPAKPAAGTAPAGTTGAAPATKPAVAPPGAAADDKSVEWAIDPGHSHVGFTVRHLGFTKVNGQFKKFSGVVRADPKTAKITSLEATAETASVDTGIDKRDTHLKGDDFFNAEKYPQLKLKLKSIKFAGNKFTAKTDLTLRDVTKEVPFKGELMGPHVVNFGQGPQQRAGYEATATINRKDFGLKYAAVTEGLSVVSDQVDLALQIELSYTAPATAATTTAPTAPVASAAPTAKPAPAPAATTAAAKPAAPVATNKPAAPPPAAAGTK